MRTLPVMRPALVGRWPRPVRPRALRVTPHGRGDAAVLLDVLVVCADLAVELRLAGAVPLGRTRPSDVSEPAHARIS